MRIEDLDRARVRRPEAEARAAGRSRLAGARLGRGPRSRRALRALSPERAGRAYDAAIEWLLERGRAFPCACSRADVARAASAPHAEDEEGPRYPRDLSGARPRRRSRRGPPRRDGVRPSASTDAASGIEFRDERSGGIAPEPAGVDDFVLRRADGTAAYQLAVVVDDAAMAIARVVRGDDLLRRRRGSSRSTARLAYPPTFAHVPLVLAPGANGSPSGPARPPSGRFETGAYPRAGGWRAGTLGGAHRPRGAANASIARDRLFVRSPATGPSGVPAFAHPPPVKVTRRPPLASRRKVTGPSLHRDTCMSAPKRPVATGTPAPATAATNRW